ncbi:uncharacterized protein BRD3OS [Festucalex cinctus]
MSSSSGPALEAAPTPAAASARAPLAAKALSESFVRLRYEDTSWLVWRQQQQQQHQQQQQAAPSTYLSRSQSAWYSNYGNSAVVVPDKSRLDELHGRSRVCTLM